MGWYYRFNSVDWNSLSNEQRIARILVGVVILMAAIILGKLLNREDDKSRRRSKSDWN